MNALWSWFLSTTIGKWILGIGAVLLAIGIAIVGGFEKGKYAEAKTNATQRIKDVVAAAKAAQETYADADAAAAKVHTDAAKQPPPNVEKRDDLDSNF